MFAASEFAWVPTDDAEAEVAIDESELHADLRSLVAPTAAPVPTAVSTATSTATPMAATMAATMAAPPSSSTFSASMMAPTQPAGRGRRRSRSRGQATMLLPPQQQQPQQQQQQPQQPQQPQQQQARVNLHFRRAHPHGRVPQRSGQRRHAPRCRAPPQAAAAAAAAGGAAVAAGVPVPATTGRRYRRHADTNIMGLKLGTLADEVAVATGEPIMCKKCRAYLSVVSRVLDHTGKVVRAGGPFKPRAGPEVDESKTGGAGTGAGDESKTETGTATATATATAAAFGGAAGGAPGTAVTGVDEGNLVWDCEFCGTRNVIDAEEDELPTDESTDYVLEGAPAASVSGEKGGAGAGDDDGIIVFAIDTSGSMCVTTAVEGKHKLKGDRTQSMRDLVGRGDASNQWFPGQNRNVTYVSRLQSVVAAVTSQIETVRREHPNKRVALVSFSNDVVIIGDGTGTERHVAGTRLEDFDRLVEAGNVALEGKVKDTAGVLMDKVHGLEEGGSTALGPALLVSVMLASKARGSRVVMCTDGLANVGLGAVDDTGDAAANAAEEFYRRVGLLAVEHGVVVDVVGIEGEGCDVETLTLAVEPSGGTITKVQPADVTRNFASMLANKAVATQVSATMFLHNILRFRSELDDDVHLGATRLMRHLGNVSKDTETSFEYGVMTMAERRAAGITAPPSHMPFQVQIHFTRLNGMKCVRVIAQSKAVTRDRRRAETHAKTAVLASHAAQQSAYLARRGSYSGSRLNMRGYQQVLNRCAQATLRAEDAAVAAQYAEQMCDLDDSLNVEMLNEARDGVSVTAGSKEAKHKRSRRRKRNDKLSKAILGKMRTNSKAYGAMPFTRRSARAPVPVPMAAPSAAAAPAPARPRPRGLLASVGQRLSAAFSSSSSNLAH